MNSSNRLKKNLVGQALSNLNLATHRDEGVRHLDIFYEEPEETLTKMRDL